VNHFVASDLICAIGIDGIIAGICLDVRFVVLRLGCVAAIVLLPGEDGRRGRCSWSRGFDQVNPEMRLSAATRW
jgi:hypothetical protein